MARMSGQILIHGNRQIRTQWNDSRLLMLFWRGIVQFILLHDLLARANLSAIFSLGSKEKEQRDGVIITQYLS
jgi:hypothetical protein